MGSYRGQYEKYYGNIKTNARNNKKHNNFAQNKNQKYIKTEHFIKKAIWQLSGSLIMLIILLILKLIPIKAANDTYIYAKENININAYETETRYILEKPEIQYIKVKTIECVQEVKSNLGMDSIDEEKN